MLGHPVVNSLWRGTTKMVSMKSTRDVEGKMYNILTQIYNVGHFVTGMTGATANGAKTKIPTSLVRTQIIFKFCQVLSRNFDFGHRVHPYGHTLASLHLVIYIFY